MSKDAVDAGIARSGASADTGLKQRALAMRIKALEAAVLDAESPPTSVEEDAEAVKRNPGQAWLSLARARWAHWQLTLSASELKDVREAYAEALQFKAVQADPSVWFELGRVYLSFGSYAGGLDILGRIVMEHPQWDGIPGVLFACGAAARRIKRLDHAVAYFGHVMACGIMPEPYTESMIMVELAFTHERRAVAEGQPLRVPSTWRDSPPGSSARLAADAYRAAYSAALREESVDSATGQRPGDAGATSQTDTAGKRGRGELTTVAPSGEDRTDGARPQPSPTRSPTPDGPGRRRPSRSRGSQRPRTTSSTKPSDGSAGKGSATAVKRRFIRQATTGRGLLRRIGPSRARTVSEASGRAVRRHNDASVATNPTEQQRSVLRSRGSSRANLQSRDSTRPSSRGSRLSSRRPGTGRSTAGQTELNHGTEVQDDPVWWLWRVSATGWLQRGQLYAQNGDPLLASDAFDEAIRLKEDADQKFVAKREAKEVRRQARRAERLARTPGSPTSPELAAQATATELTRDDASQRGRIDDAASDAGHVKHTAGGADILVVRHAEDKYDEPFSARGGDGASTADAFVAHTDGHVGSTGRTSSRTSAVGGDGLDGRPGTGGSERVRPTRSLQGSSDVGRRARRGDESRARTAPPSRLRGVASRATEQPSGQSESTVVAKGQGEQAEEAAAGGSNDDAEGGSESELRQRRRSSVAYMAQRATDHVFTSSSEDEDSDDAEAAGDAGLWLTAADAGLRSGDSGAASRAVDRLLAVTKGLKSTDVKATHLALVMRVDNKHGHASAQERANAFLLAAVMRWRATRARRAAAGVIQRAFRSYVVRSKFKKLYLAAASIQSLVRGYRIRSHIARLRLAAAVIELAWINDKPRRNERERKLAEYLEEMRIRAEREAYRDKVRSALEITQAFVRRVGARAVFVRSRNAAATIQRAFRSFSARVALYHRRQFARWVVVKLAGQQYRGTGSMINVRRRVRAVLKHSRRRDTSSPQHSALLQSSVSSPGHHGGRIRDWSSESDESVDTDDSARTPWNNHRADASDRASADEEEGRDIASGAKIKVHPILQPAASASESVVTVQECYETLMPTKKVPDMVETETAFGSVLLPAEEMPPQSPQLPSAWARADQAAEAEAAGVVNGFVMDEEEKAARRRRRRAAAIKRQSTAERLRQKEIAAARAAEELAGVPLRARTGAHQSDKRRLPVSGRAGRWAAASSALREARTVYGNKSANDPTTAKSLATTRAFEGGDRSNFPLSSPVLSPGAELDRLRGADGQWDGSHSPARREGVASWAGPRPWHASEARATQATVQAAASPPRRKDATDKLKTRAESLAAIAAAPLPETLRWHAERAGQRDSSQRLPSLVHKRTRNERSAANERERHGSKPARSAQRQSSAAFTGGGLPGSSPSQTSLPRLRAAKSQKGIAASTMKVIPWQLPSTWSDDDELERVSPVEESDSDSGYEHTSNAPHLDRSLERRFDASSNFDAARNGFAAESTGPRNGGSNSISSLWPGASDVLRPRTGERLLAPSAPFTGSLDPSVLLQTDSRVLAAHGWQRFSRDPDMEASAWGPDEDRREVKELMWKTERIALQASASRIHASTEGRVPTTDRHSSRPWEASNAPLPQRGDVVNPFHGSRPTVVLSVSEDAEWLMAEGVRAADSEKERAVRASAAPKPVRPIKTREEVVASISAASKREDVASAAEDNLRLAVSELLSLVARDMPRFRAESTVQWRNMGRLAVQDVLRRIPKEWDDPDDSTAVVPPAESAAITSRVERLLDKFAQPRETPESISDDIARAAEDVLTGGGGASVTSQLEIAAAAAAEAARVAELQRQRSEAAAATVKGTAQLETAEK